MRGAGEPYHKGEDPGRGSREVIVLLAGFLPRRRERIIGQNGFTQKRKCLRTAGSVFSVYCPYESVAVAEGSRGRGDSPPSRLCVS